MAREAQTVQDVIPWIHPLDRIYKDSKNLKEWTCDDDALACDLMPLNGVDFMRLETFRSQLTKEDTNPMARSHKVAQDVIEKYVLRVYNYTVRLTEKGRELAKGLFDFTFDAGLEVFTPRNGKELWVACAIAQGMEYAEVLDPIVLALQNSSILELGIRKKSPSQSDTESGGNKTAKDSAAGGAEESKPEAPTSLKPNGGDSETATALRMTS